MPLQGTFDVLDFTEVLRLLSRHQLTGRLHVRHRSFGANLFLESGQLTGADQSEHQPAAGSGDVRGRIEEICFEMLEAERGSFEFQPGKASALPVTTRYRVDTVLGQARKRLDEWRELQELIPSLELQPRLVGDLAQSEVTIDKERWRMLTSVDGRRNLRAIGRILNVSDFDVCRVLAGLMKDGVVELDGLASLSAATRDAMPTVAGPEPSDRIPAAVGGRQTLGIRTSGFRTTNRPTEGGTAADATTPSDGGAPVGSSTPQTGRSTNGRGRKAAGKGAARKAATGGASDEVVDVTNGTHAADRLVAVGSVDGIEVGGAEIDVTGSDVAGSHLTGSDPVGTDRSGVEEGGYDEPDGGDIVARVFGRSPATPGTVPVPDPPGRQRVGTAAGSGADAVDEPVPDPNPVGGSSGGPTAESPGPGGVSPDSPATGGVDARRRRIVRIRTRHAPGTSG